MKSNDSHPSERTLERREWMRGVGALGVAFLGRNLVGCGDGDDLPPLPVDLPVYAYDGPPGPEALFGHGVASGDPAEDGFVLWTRVSPADASTSIDVFYEIARDPAFTQRVDAGTVTTGPDVDYTVKVETRGLVWGRTYYYRFHGLGRASPIGRARVAPIGDVNRLRFAVASCASLAHGYFHVYRRIAERNDLDAILHLGDYIYEYGSGEYGDVRAYEPAHEIVSLEDYRTRYAQYRRDPDLQELHRQHPMIAIWDDHESANDAYEDGAENHDPETEGAWEARRAAAKQAYFEWMPVRLPDPDGNRIYRALRYGDLVDLVMLDTRLEGRDMQLDSLDDDAETRTLLGASQEAWLDARLAESTTRWVLIGQQVMVSQLRIGSAYLNLDQWDGYPAARRRLLASVREHALGRTVVLTGDIHTSWAGHLSEDPFAEGFDPAADSAAVELVTPSVTSPGIGTPNLADRLAASIRDQSPHLVYAELKSKGYLVLDVTRGAVRGDFYFVDGILEGQGEESFAAGYETEYGSATLTVASSPRPSARGSDPAP